MKAKIIYFLPEDELDYNRANKAFDMASALYVISQYLRKVDKYETGDDIDKIREKFYEVLTSYDINLDKLIE